MDNTLELPGSGTKSSPMVKFRSPSPPSAHQKSPMSSSRKHSTTFTTSFVQTPSGPVLTPNRDSTSMILLSPSRTIADSLTALASSTAQQLEQVWDEVGYNPEERASQLSDLLRQFRNLCDEKISEERGVAETFREEIRKAQDELRNTGKALKRLVDPQLLRDTMIGHSLTDQLDDLEQALEGLRAAAAVAQQDLTECLDYLVEAHASLGWELEEQWEDIESDWTVERREAFHVKVAEVKQHVATRSDSVVALVLDCQQMMHELRLDDDDEAPLDRRILGSLVRSKDGSYMLASKMDMETESCVGIGPTVLDDLTERLEQLTAERRSRKMRLQALGEAIANLWEKLRIPEDEQKQFTRGIQGLGMDTIQKGEDELERLHKIKGAMLKDLVLEARNRIASLWEETNTTEGQQQAFTPYLNNDEAIWDFDLLDKHDDYILVLEGRLEQMKPILRVLERREEILEERMEYEKLQHNSERLQQRGAALTKQLMREEKMAKRIKRELPKLTSTLESMLNDWNEEHGEDFLFHGKVYLDVMQGQEEEWNQYKKNEQDAKLKKKQEERVMVENRYGAKTYSKALPGRKKPIKPRPLAASNR